MQFTETAAKIEALNICGDARTTVFLTNAAGFLLTVLTGFPGLEADAGDPAGWAKYPVTLPAGWERITVERLWARERPFRLEARHGDARARMTWLED